MVGQILVNFLFASAIVSSGAYFLSLRNDDAQLRKIGRMFFLLVFGGMLIASGMLLYNLLTHDFRYTYVQSYSSRELPWFYLVSTFYAGQEGSFMLWTLLVSTIGVGLLPYVRKHKYESAVMGFYGLILVFLLLKIVAKSPFAYVWETYAADGIANGFVPMNGRGLNPLLQNIWITIHPPILFTGFASMSVPFAFAMAALVKRDYHHWVKVALPWTLFATAVLGFGIMLGGFWAYETLGWGGFWGWDPVENSSLIPWIVCVALVHTMLTQRKTKGLVKTNIALAVTAFILVLYSTFLTRSGILGDTSVHSFVDPGFFAYVLLLVFMATFAIIGYGMILYRRKDIMAIRTDFSITSREFSVAIGSAVLLGSAAFILLGTSWPVLMEILHRPKFALDVAYYNRIHLPLAILITLVNALSILQSWRVTGKQNFVRRMIPPLGLAIVSTIAAWVLGIRDLAFTALAFGSFFALFVNLDVAARILTKKPTMGGAYISHFGITLLFLGIITTSRYTLTEHIRLVQDEPVAALGYTFTYTGREQVEKQYADREKYNYFVKVTDPDGSNSVVKPVLYWSDFNKRQSAFLEPGISWGLIKDVYISPKAIETEGNPPSVTIGKNQPVAIPVDSSYTITLQRFDMTAMMQNTDPNTDKLRMGAVVTIAHNGTETEHTLFTTFTGNMGSRLPEVLAIPNTTYSVMFDKLIPEPGNLSQSKVTLTFVDTANPATQPKEVFTVEASVKPLIGLVWTGVILMVFGFVVSIVRRTGELKKVLAEDRTPAATTTDKDQPQDRNTVETSVGQQ